LPRPSGNCQVLQGIATPFRAWIIKKKAASNCHALQGIAKSFRELPRPSGRGKKNKTKKNWL